ncbi:hypothetical protein EVG20_g5656 [Dentipellis fragilis]|uniref:SET domain-containing protein n=1 Tax=Dentipellis fragilis TaxID=205917 RepID=A0A4Y9YSW7_9AGAM|nr:hypothetical protein EVG20_g5656 [Dentipellis fragilis]
MSSQAKPPKNWPSDVHFINSQRFHSSVTTTARAFVQGPQTKTHEADTLARAPSLVVIRRITEPSHPACGQYGLFASKKIPPRTHLIDYLGEVHCDDRPHSDYDISLHRFQDGVNIGSDANTMGNDARFVNDYRGVRHKPNVEFRDRRTQSGELRMSVWSLTEPVKKGEELVVSYGKAWWQARLASSDPEEDPEDVKVQYCQC